MTDGRIDLNTAIYVGIDVHKFTHTAVAANRFEEEIGELTFENTPSGIGRFLSWIKNLDRQDKARIFGIEGSNGNGRLLKNSLIPHFKEVYEVNPVFTKQRRDHGTSGDKSDPVDAGLIIEVLTRKLDKLPKVTNQDNSDLMQSLEKLVIFHDDLVRSQTRLKNQLHTLFHEEDSSYKTKRRTAFNQKSIKYWSNRLKRDKQSEYLRDRMRRMITREKISQFNNLTLIRKKTDTEIANILSLVNSNLLTLPGAGLITAAKIIANSKDIRRFSRIDKFIKYAGISPVKRQSGKSKKHKQAKGGNRQLNTAIYTIALVQLRHIKKAKDYFLKKIAEGKTKKHAIRCLMKRVACIVYGMLKTGEQYRVIV